MARRSCAKALEQHLGQTLEHVHRLEHCFRELGKHAGSETVNAMKGLIKDGERGIGDIPQSALRDAATIGTAKRVEDFEMAAYAGTITFVHLLAYEQVAELPEQTLLEEREADATLTRIAGSTVNPEARQLGAHQHQ